MSELILIGNKLRYRLNQKAVFLTQTYHKKILFQIQF